LPAGFSFPQGLPGRLPRSETPLLGGPGFRGGDLHGCLRSAELRRAQRGEDGPGLPELPEERWGLARGTRPAAAAGS
ncbi:hypothetical protein Anapl_05764, partial [Anas platyrhynchos]